MSTFDPNCAKSVITSEAKDAVNQAERLGELQQEVTARTQNAQLPLHKNLANAAISIFYNNLLSGFMTQIVNTTTGANQIVLNRLNSITAAGLDMVVPGERVLSMTQALSEVQGVIAAFPAMLKVMPHILKGREAIIEHLDTNLFPPEFLDKLKMMEYHDAWNPEKWLGDSHATGALIFKALGVSFNAATNVLAHMDVFPKMAELGAQYQREYTRAYEHAQQFGKAAQDLAPAIAEEAVKRFKESGEGVLAADRTTYTDSPGLLYNKLRDTMNEIPMITFMQPITKILGRILQATGESSPLAPVWPTRVQVNETEREWTMPFMQAMGIGWDGLHPTFKPEKIDRAKSLDLWSKVLVNAGIALGGLALVKDHWQGPAPDGIAERELMTNGEGIQPYSFQVGNYNIPFKLFAPPVALWLMASSALNSVINRHDPNSPEDQDYIANAMSAFMLATAEGLATNNFTNTISQVSVELSKLRAIEAKDDTEKPFGFTQDKPNRLIQVAISSGAKLISPAVVRDISSIVDPTLKDTTDMSFDKPEGLEGPASLQDSKELSYTQKNIIKDWPFKSEKLTTRIDVMGDPIYGGWDKTFRGIEPGEYAKLKKVVAHEIRTLGVPIGYPGRVIDKVALTSKEFEMYSRLAGRGIPGSPTLVQAIGEIMTDPSYKTYSQKLKVNLIHDRILSYRDQARKVMLSLPDIADRNEVVRTLNAEP